MMSYILVLIALPLLCVLWFLLQSWLTKIDADYKGYKPGCGGCKNGCSNKQ